jgi:hypothetical protein
MARIGLRSDYSGRGFGGEDLLSLDDPSRNYDMPALDVSAGLSAAGLDTSLLDDVGVAPDEGLGQPPPGGSGQPESPEGYGGFGDFIMEAAGPRYVAKKERAEKEEIKKREKIMADDSLTMLQFMDKGDYEKAAAFASDREARVIDLGGNPITTQAWQIGIENKRYDAVETVLRKDVLRGQEKGYIPKDQPDINKLSGYESYATQEKEQKAEKRQLEIDRLKSPKGPSALLLKDLPAGIRQQATEAFKAAGGGKEGLKAMNAQVALSQTRADIASVPNTLRKIYPNATPENMEELLAITEGSTSTQMALTRAEKLRTNQRAVDLKAATGEDVVRLTQSILDDVNLPDVIGSMEGKEGGLIDWFRVDDDEYGVIAQIDQLAALLTKENLGLLKGVISDRDIIFLQKIVAGGINRQRDLAGFTAEMQRLQGVFKPEPEPEPESGASLGALPPGTTANEDGTYTLSDGRRVRAK